MIEISKVQQILQYILKTNALYPDDCLHCIVNEALDDFKVPLFVSGDKITVKPYKEPENCTDCEHYVANYVDMVCTITDKVVDNPNTSCPIDHWSSIKCP